MYGGILHKFKHSAPAAACDYTPNSVNWVGPATVTDQGPGGWDYEAVVQQITGISCDITLKAEYTRTFIKLYYKTSSNGSLSLSFNDPNGSSNYLSNNGWTYLAPNDTFTVANNQYVYFCPSDPTTLEDRTVTIKNNSDGAVTLDSFDIESY